MIASGSSQMRTESTSSNEAMIPSLKRKPTASSSSCVGVAIIVSHSCPFTKSGHGVSRMIPFSARRTSSPVTSQKCVCQPSAAISSFIHPLHF